MKKIITSFLFSIFGVALFVVPAFASTTVVVQPNNMQGWVFINDQTNGAGSGSLVNGPTGQPLGLGSAQLNVTGSSDGQILALGQYDGTKLSNLTTLTYWTYQNSSNTSHSTAIALQFNVVSDVTSPSPSWQGRIVYEPYYNNGGTVPLGSWKEWDALNSGSGLWWFSGPSHFGGNCPQSSPCTWNHILSLFPNIGVNPIHPGVVFKAGSGWAAFTGNVDDFTIGVSGNNTTYDFEPACTSVMTSKGAMTAAVVDPSSPYSGNLNATGCQIGVYFDQNGSVSGANISGASYYGVFVDGKNTGNTSVDVTTSTVSQTGDNPFDGAQHGNAIYYYGYYTPGTVTGNVLGNTIDNYQKGGIIVNGSNATVNVTNNTVTGLGKVAFIAQNGIQVGFGASARLTGNTVTGNFYETGQNMRTGNGPWVSCGLLFYSTSMSKSEQGRTMSQNTSRDNQLNLCNF